MYLLNTIIYNNEAWTDGAEKLWVNAWRYFI